MEPAQLNAIIDATGRVMNQFRLERLTFLAVAVCSAVFTAYSVYVLLDRAGPLDVKSLGTVFGSTGIMAAASFRVAHFLNRTFDLVEFAIRGAPPAPPPPAPDGAA